jgi:hypothetical protein
MGFGSSEFRSTICNGFAKGTDSKGGAGNNINGSDFVSLNERETTSIVSEDGSTSSWVIYQVSTRYHRQEH